MAILKGILTAAFVVLCIVFSVIVLLQEGKSAGLSGSISGAAETFWGKNKGRTIEGKLEKITKYLAIAFFALAVILNVL